MLELDSATVGAFGGEIALKERVAAFALALEAHAFTVNVPAPVEHAIVEQIVREHAGEYSLRPDDAPPPPEDRLSILRARRDALLRESDWTQLADAPVDQRKWALYREQLRNMDFDEANWPGPPGTDMTPEDEARINAHLGRSKGPTADDSTREEAKAQGERESTGRA